MHLGGITLILGLLATPWASAVVYQDLELDSVVIADSPDCGLELEAAEEATTPSGVEGCTNNNGDKGTCKTMEQCFPYLADYDKEYYNLYPLYEILNETATPCPGDSGLICCPQYGYGLPTKKPQFEGQTSERPSTEPNSTIPAPDGYGVRENCGGHNYIDDRVVGGREANIGEFPYAVALLNNGRQFCGGSLISEQWVLTAAHCIANLKSFASVAANIGDHDLKQSGETRQQTRGVKRGFYHRSFSFSHLQHDVALLQLASPVTLGGNIQTVCLSNMDPSFGDNAVLAGWGKQGKNLPPATKLRTVTMTIIPHAECQKKYASEPMAPKVTANMVCAGDQKPVLKDACNGDSGGPLVEMKPKAVQIGVVSWGIGCGDKPGVYTRVNKYLDWIDKNSKRA